MKQTDTMFKLRPGWVSILAGLTLLALSVFFQQAFAEGIGTNRKGFPSKGEAEPVEEKLLKSLPVDSIHAHENFLFINDERYIPTRRTRILDERGKKASIEEIRKKGLIDLRYGKWPKSESMPYGPDEKILLEIRVLNPRHQEAQRP